MHRLEPTVSKFYTDYGEDVPMCDFSGITLVDLYRIETAFKINIFVYTIVEATDEKTTAELVRRSLYHYPETMTVNLYGSNFSYVQDVQQYRCRKCGESLWKRPYLLHRHERSCQGGVRHVFPGGVYHPSPSVFQRLDDEGIRVVGFLMLLQ